MGQVGFIGAGNMAEAIVAGLCAGSYARPSSIVVFDIVPERMERLRSVYGVRSCASAAEAARGSDAVVIAVKPHQVRDVLADNRDALSGTLVIGIAAGVTLRRMLEELGPHARVVRVMPNTACLVRQGVSVLCASSRCSEKDIGVAREIFQSVGICLEMEERYFDAVTALSGSGPAYCFVFLEALCDGAVRAGLPRDVAYTLAAATLKGASAMALGSETHPARLKDMVTSPGGTTIEGIAALEAGGFRSAVIEAVTAAWLRSRDLSQEG